MGSINGADQGTVVDGVQRFPSNGIKVVIIGGGVGGLGAAMECWRKGCDVVVLERGSGVSPFGDYFTITPSAQVALKEYPSMLNEYHKAVYDCSIHIYTSSGTAVKSTFPEWRLPGVEHAAPDVKLSFLNRRPVYAKWQLEQVQRLGIPVHFNQKIVNVEETKTGVIVTTEEGERYTGDLCIGSMGIGSTIKGFNTGPEIAVQDSGYAVARVAFPRSCIKEGSPAASLLENVENNPQFRTYLADDLHLILFLTKDDVAWVFTHRNDGVAAESWRNGRNVEDFIPYLERASDHWDPAVLDFVRQTPTNVVDWNLRWRDYSEQWTSEGGRLLRLGDAAHAFFPTAGNGAVQALEDTLSIAECLRIAGKENVQWATKVHNKLRFERTAILQRTGFVNREELHFADLEAIERDPENNNHGFFKIGRWVWNHNPEAYARDNYEACLDALKNGKQFTNTNLPSGHVFEPWSLESEMARMKAGKPSNLKENGDWGY